MSEQPDNLCVLRLSSIGDVCHTLPVVHTLRAALPETRITWIIGAVEAGLVEGLPGVELVVLDKREGWRGLRKLKRALSGRRFDVLLHMQAAFRASLASRMIRADERIGFDRVRARDGQWLFTNRRIEFKPRQHVMDGLFGFAEALGITERHLVWDIPLGEEDIAFAERQVPEFRGAIAVSCCASSATRDWLVDRYAAVADYAAAQYGQRVILTGGPTPAEREAGEAVQQAMKRPCTNLIGKTSLKQMLAVLGRCAALITPDSGPAHLGTAAGVPVIGLYAVSNPERAGPYFSRHLVVNRYPENVRRYFGKDVDQVPWGARVRLADGMAAITVAEVKARINAVMACRGYHDPARSGTVTTTQDASAE